MIVKKLGRGALVSLLAEMSSPGHSDKDSETLLLTFCLNCPDPVSAMNVVLDAPRGASDSEIVDKALSLPRRSVATCPEAELSMDHPLRHWTLED